MLFYILHLFPFIKFTLSEVHPWCEKTFRRIKYGTGSKISMVECNDDTACTSAYHGCKNFNAHASWCIYVQHIILANTAVTKQVRHYVYKLARQKPLLLPTSRLVLLAPATHKHTQTCSVSKGKCNLRHTCSTDDKRATYSGHTPLCPFGAIELHKFHKPAKTFTWLTSCTSDSHCCSWLASLVTYTSCKRSAVTYRP